jgi:hypothetical protein
MAIQALLPVALGALGAYQGYRSARESGAGGIGRLLGAGLGGFGGYTMGTSLGGMFPSQAATGSMAGNVLRTQGTNPLQAQRLGGAAAETINLGGGATPARGNLLDVFFRKSPGGEIDPLKLALTTAGGAFVSGAFNQGPTDIFMPGYNMGYLELANQRGNFRYIDPETGEEKEYSTVYKPEEQGLGDRRIGSYSMPVARLNTGGLASINKFNEGGINYLPSKVSHDENDSNNYVRASGYVEDGSGAGDKDEDTMLAQLADGEFVTRADGVLGAGIIAGGNPNSIRDMREKGAQYFYEQQRRYKRVFDLLKGSNGNAKQKEN